MGNSQSWPVESRAGSYNKYYNPPKQDPKVDDQAKRKTIQLANKILKIEFHLDQLINCRNGAGKGKRGRHKKQAYSLQIQEYSSLLAQLKSLRRHY